MNRLFFLIPFAVCTANYTFSQNQVVCLSKEPAAATEKKSGLLNTADSLTSSSGTCVMDLKKSTVSAKDTIGNQHSKAGNPPQQELHMNNARTINGPVSPLMKDEK